MPAIRAAREVNKRPTSFIMRDDWFDHRHPHSGAPFGDKDEWTFWDFQLLDVVQTIEDYTMDSGVLAWQHDDPAVDIEAEKYTDKYYRAVEAKTQAKNHKPSPGDRYRPRLRMLTSSRSMWTFRDWVEDAAEKSRARKEDETG